MLEGLVGSRCRGASLMLAAFVLGSLAVAWRPVPAQQTAQQARPAQTPAGAQTAAPLSERPAQGAPSPPAQATDIRPALIGDVLPPLVLRTPEDAPFDVNAALAERPALLIFFRGGWCPYCTRHLSALAEIEAQLAELGFQILAITPDLPALLAAQEQQEPLGYRLLSDPDMAASRALGIAFQVEEELVSKYRDSYGVDLEARSGASHHLLPVPSAFLVGRDGAIRFSYVNPDYSVRVDGELLLAAARAALKQGAAAPPAAADAQQPPAK